MYANDWLDMENSMPERPWFGHKRTADARTGVSEGATATTITDVDAVVDVVGIYCRLPMPMPQPRRARQIITNLVREASHRACPNILSMRG